MHALNHAPETKLQLFKPIERFVFPSPTMHIQLYNVANDAAYIIFATLEPNDEKYHQFF